VRVTAQTAMLGGLSDYASRCLRVAGQPGAKRMLQPGSRPPPPAAGRGGEAASCRACARAAPCARAVVQNFSSCHAAVPVRVGVRQARDPATVTHCSTGRCVEPGADFTVASFPSC